MTVLVFLENCEECNKAYDYRYLQILGGKCRSCNTFNKRITNETLGITTEYLICKIKKLKFNLNLDRVNLIVATYDLFLTLLYALAELPEITKYIGYKNESVDYVTKNGTLSLKTNKSGDKVCPQGAQGTLKKFAANFLPYSKHYNKRIVKNYVLNHPKILVETFLKWTFCCNHLLWIFYDRKEGHFDYRIYKDYKRIKLDSKHFRFTQTINWNESTTLKYKEVSIGEFQDHKNRDCFKFRFHMKKLCYLVNLI
jgi:hypothetical protein